MNSVLVVGSINMDLVVETARFPMPGETVTGHRFNTFPGGKGANQAVAAQRLGAQVTLLGCVGDDAFGQHLLQHLAAEGIDLHHVRTAPRTPSGVASITVSGTENAIVVVPGANHQLRPADVFAAEAAFAAADVVLAQLEIPLDAVRAVANMAERYRKPFLLNPAPAAFLPEDILARVTLLTPNAHELSLLFPPCEKVPQGWQGLLAAWPGRLLMTQGAQGVWYVDDSGVLCHQASFPVSAVDSTGAGDTFNGALAAFWGQEFSSVIRLAAAAGALSVTRAGAQQGMPSQIELERFLVEHETRIEETNNTVSS